MATWQERHFMMSEYAWCVQTLASSHPFFLEGRR